MFVVKYCPLVVRLIQRDSSRRLLTLNNNVAVARKTMLSLHPITPLMPTGSGVKLCPILGLNQKREYAKNKDKKKEKHKKSVEVNEGKLREFLNIDNLNTQMQKAIQLMQEDYKKNLSLRSTIGSIETLRISTNGAEHELQELAQISRKNPKTIIVNMIAFPQTIPDVLKAIEKSGMNLNPQQDGTTVFIPIPKVTKEHRESLTKNAKAIFIKYRDMIKSVQNNAIKKLKKQSDVSEDDLHAVQDQITTIGDKYVSEAEKMLNAKQKELIGES